MTISTEQPPESTDPELGAYLRRMFDSVNVELNKSNKYLPRTEMPYKAQIGDTHYFGDPSTHNYDATITREGFWGYTSDGWIYLGGSMDFGLDVARGLISGVSQVNKFGRNPDIDTAQEDVWDGGGTYTFSTTADITDIVSSNAADTMDIEVQGLDTNWNLVTQTKTLTGTTSVALDTPLIRIFRMKNISATAAVGTIQCGVGSTTTSFSAANLRAQITLGYEQTLMAIYSIPAGKTGYLIDHWANMNKSNTSGACDVSLYARSFGGVFRIQTPTGLVAAGSSHYQHQYKAYPSYSEKSDLIMRGIGSTNNFDISAGFDLYLVDNP